MWPGGKISKRSQSSFNAFISEAKYTAPTPQKNKQMTKFQSMLLIRFWRKVLLFRFYNRKSCCCRLRWNCKKESWWSWYHRFPNPGRVVLCQLGHEQRWRTCRASLPKQRRTCHQACPLLPRQHPRTAAAQPIIIIIINPTQFLPFHNKFRSHADQHWCRDSKQSRIWN